MSKRGKYDHGNFIICLLEIYNIVKYEENTTNIHGNKMKVMVIDSIFVYDKKHQFLYSDTPNFFDGFMPYFSGCLDVS